MDLLNTLVDKGLRRELPTREEALAVLATSDDDLLDVVAAAGKVRRHWFGRRVKLNYLVNLKSGPVPRGLLLLLAAARLQGRHPQVHLAEAGRGLEGRGGRAGRAAPSGSAWWRAGAGRRTGTSTGSSKTIEAIKDQTRGRRGVRLPRAALRRPGRAAARRRARTPTTTTSTRPRRPTATSPPPTPTRTGWTPCRRRTRPGLSACSGLIAGMGESDEDLVDVVFSLRELDPDSVPVNFLIPFEGTPLAKEWNLTPQRCLRILAMVRFVCPDVGGADRGRPRGPSAHDAAARPAPGQLDLPRRLPDQRGPGRPGRPRHDRGRRLRGGGHRHGRRCPSTGAGGRRLRVARVRRRPCGDGRRPGLRRRDAGERRRARTDLVAVRRRGAGTDLAPNA